MAFPRRLASMLLVSWILLLYWTASSAESHDLHQSPRIRRQMAFRTREVVAASSQVVKDSLTVIKEALASAQASRAIDVIKSISKVANLAPGIAGLVASFINVALAFIPQENPLTELRRGFDEVNRKLDSLSIQISNLATDVEWFNYASVYSQDEVRILNAWNKFTEFRQSSELAQSEEAKLQLAEMFTSHYESSGAEASVSNLYHYLTVSSTALSGNLNNLLIKKFKCGVPDISRFNLYFSSLLWKGMVVSQVYWNLMGFYSSGKEDQHIQMFKKVHEVQSSAVDLCQKNYEEYMKKDVVEITKRLIPDKDAIAKQVKEALDKKYDWYSWVVLVYDSNNNSSYKLFDVTPIEVGNIMVVVAYTLRGDEENVYRLKQTTKHCFEGQSCEIGDQISTCKWTYAYAGGEHPTPIQQVDCSWYIRGGKISVHLSRRKEVCTQSTCQNNGKCKRLLDSNDWLCDCQDGYHGDTRNKKVDITLKMTKKKLLMGIIQLH
uniref:EGF-like domain-containing protein n=1 Tax=Amphiprion percula TaxID=161767 RepID=A0A3P8SHY1_AMPPE